MVASTNIKIFVSLVGFVAKKTNNLSHPWLLLYGEYISIIALLILLLNEWIFHDKKHIYSCRVGKTILLMDSLAFASALMGRRFIRASPRRSGQYGQCHCRPSAGKSVSFW